MTVQKCLFIVHHCYIIIRLSTKQLLLQILGRKHLMILIFLSSPTKSSHHSWHLSWEIFRWNQLAARVLMLETTDPHFNLKITKKQLQRKLGEYGPKKPRAVSTLQPFRGAFVFAHEQENKWGDDWRRKRRGQSAHRICIIRQSSTRRNAQIVGTNWNKSKKRIAEFNIIHTRWTPDPGQSRASSRWRSCKTSIPGQTPSPPSRTAEWPSFGRPRGDFWSLGTRIHTTNAVKPPSLPPPFFACHRLTAQGHVGARSFSGPQFSSARLSSCEHLCAFTRYILVIKFYAKYVLIKDNSGSHEVF